MLLRSIALCLVMSLVVAVSGLAQQSTGETEVIPFDQYDPVPMLKAQETIVERARFPAIDVHNHMRHAGSPADIDEAIRAMNASNVAVVVSFDGGLGEQLAGELQRMDERYPGRFVQCMRLDWQRIDEPDFGGKMAAEMQKGYEMGSRCLKISKALGLSVRDQTGELIPVDDQRLDPVWAKCAELNIPVMIHTADPVAFWTPLDRHNERMIELADHPNWAYGPEFPARDTLIRQRNNVIERHPETTFVALHMAGAPEDLQTVGIWLDKYPNMMIETGARVSELGRQPYTARRFLIQYQDRIMFGTDSCPIPGAKLAEDGAVMYRIHWRWFESADEYFDVAKTHHLQALWRVYGVFLPDEVLEKLYNRNALKIFPHLKFPVR